MMRSLYAGVSGLQNHQTRMDVIGNNISNVNTIGFKKGRVNFTGYAFPDHVRSSPSNRRSRRSQPQTGGAWYDRCLHRYNSYPADPCRPPVVMTDVAIQGNGFFVLKSGDKEFFTRAGAFGIDESGLLVNPG